MATSAPISLGLQPGEVLTNSIGMKFAAIPSGEFLMGSPDSDQNAQDNEKPQHSVVISKGFFMSVHNVTYGQWRVFQQETGYVTEGERNGRGSFGIDLTTGKVEPKPIYTWNQWIVESEEFASGFEITDNHPIVCVSWDDAHEFARWLGTRDGVTYRLPTEAEWEYAARAGTTTSYYNGDSEDELHAIANVADASLQRRWTMLVEGNRVKLPPYAKPWDDGFPFTSPVGQFAPNAWGLYDMYGNVGEWCLDWYSANYYERSPVMDPAGPATGDVVDFTAVLPGSEPRALRVVRGGVWLDPASGCRSADRSTMLRHPVDTAADIGIRLVREA